MSAVAALLLGDGPPGSEEGGGDECEDDVGVVGGARVLWFEVVLVCDFGEVGAGDVEQVALVGRAPVVSAEPAVQVVEGGCDRVVVAGYADHHKSILL